MSLLDLKPLTDEELASITPHEKAVMSLIETLNGSLHGFPDHERKLFNVAKAWARFVSLEAYHVKFDPDWERLESPEYVAEAKAKSAWKEGVIPGEWLVQRIHDTCKFMPSPVEAREIYWDSGWPTLDGERPQRLDGSDRQVSQE